jgi:hypothetical protein
LFHVLRPSTQESLTPERGKNIQRKEYVLHIALHSLVDRCGVYSIPPHLIYGHHIKISFINPRALCCHLSFLSMLVSSGHIHTDKKERKNFHRYMEVQMGSGAKSYIRKGFLV